MPIQYVFDLVHVHVHVHVLLLCLTCTCTCISNFKSLIIAYLFTLHPAKQELTEFASWLNAFIQFLF